jgi:hypothetical protein
LEGACPKTRTAPVFWLINISVACATGLTAKDADNAQSANTKTCEETVFIELLS